MISKHWRYSIGMCSLVLALGGVACNGAVGTQALRDSGVAFDAGNASDAGGNTADSAVDVDAGPLLPTTVHTFAVSGENFLNPERGFYHTSHLNNASSVMDAANEGSSLVYADVRLDDYRESEIPASFLNDVQEGLDAARAEGVKIVLRFLYNEGPYPDSEPDASLSWVQSHLRSFGPLIRDNVDVIAVMQAGFIGAWGEWHTSTNNLTTPENERAVLEAILAELPEGRAVQIRTPMEKEELYGAALTAATAWSSTPAARIGHHNDCFLSSEDDVGTYPSDAVEMWKNYVAQETLYTPMGGETCDPFPERSDCAPALEEMERLHFTYINADYHPDIVSGWESGGCRETMEKYLGYRLVMIDAELPTEIVAGASTLVRIRLRNDGYAAPINSRPVVIEVVAGTRRIPFVIEGEDPRRWLPGTEITLERVVQMPADIGSGSVTFTLALHDAASALAADVRYSMRTANTGTWDATNGVNILGTVP
ncbi:MAG: DUF4832 domain-containing protein [Sandaracinaceae bacterium]|nr:DUF4832 domain-containing protein [Sandaracinaceae bacterium]